MAQYEVNNCSVSSLLANIKDGTIAIPEIQRPFVWDASKVRDLIDSLYHGYPVGYIIIWQNPDVRLKDGTTSIGRKVIIDGQQRITALTAAIVGKEVLSSDYKKKNIIIAFNPINEAFEVRNPAIEKDIAWIPDISKIFMPGFSSYKFINEYSAKNQIDDEETKAKLNEIITQLVQIQNNNMGVIELSHELDIEQVTNIFIRINSKGVVLSQADFAMSKISSNEEFGGNITRKTIDYFCHLMQTPADFSSIKENDTDFVNGTEFNKIKWVIDETEDIYIPDYSDVLRVAFAAKFHRGKIADLVNLLSGRDFATREYKTEIAEDTFKKLHDAVLDVVNQTNFQRYLMIVKSVGIVDSSLIRSQNVLNFGYTLFIALRDKGIQANTIETVVRRWLVLSILTSRYSGSAESVFDYDIKRFIDAEDPTSYLEQTEAMDLSDAFWNNVLPVRLNTPVASSPFFNVFLMAQVKAGDKGFLSEQIEVKSMLEHKGDIHHLFPKKYLVSNGINNKAQYNQIANYVYLQSEINIKISDTAPSKYMEAILNQCETKQPVYGGITDKDALMKNLDDNCIPRDFVSMQIEDYERFLSERRLLMARKIRDYYEGLK